MEIRLIKNIEIKFNVEAIKKKLRIEEEDDVMQFNQMLNTVMEIANPQIVFGEAYVTERYDDGIKINEIRFNCILMKNNLANVNRVFPFIATCGQELYKWAKGIEDIFERYWADHIMEIVLRRAIRKLYTVVNSQYGLVKPASMNPGSLEGWPIEQQKMLFELMENKQKSIGVELTETFLMIPQKSVSGILFKSKSGYSNCKLCEMKNCPSRSALFEPELRKKLMGVHEA